MTPSTLEIVKSAGWLHEQNYIGGAWQGADNGETRGVQDPATGATIGTIAWSGTAETRRAIDAAHGAFRTWSMTTADERAGLLLNMAAIIRQNVEAIASMLTLEQGKPLAEARSEILLGASYVQWFAEEARRINGEIIPSPWPDRQLLVTREPVGVVGAISPWNFPFSMLARKVAPALASGCTIVVKPSEFTPYCGLLWGLLAERAGLPAGVCHVYVESTADVKMAVDIVINAKISRPSVCNSLDTLIVDEKIARRMLKALIPKLEQYGVTIHADKLSFELMRGYPLLQKVRTGDFAREWLSLACSVKVVKNVNEALAHIRTYSTRHSEAIVSANKKLCERFLHEVDAAAVYSNASTRFTDGEQFGLGAEIGISTQKLHARGPFALEKLVTEKWVIRGNGQIRS